MKRYYEIELMRVVEVTQKAFVGVEAESFDEAREKAKSAPDVVWSTEYEQAGSTEILTNGDPYWREDAEAAKKQKKKGSQ